MAINRALSWRRRIRREARALARVATRRPAQSGEPVVGGVVWSEVRRLPRQQAAMIALVYVDDMTVEQAAEVLGISIPTGKTHLQRARRTLAERLNEEIHE